MKKVMVVDDEEEMRKFFTKLIARKGFEAVSCGDGITAVKMYDTEKPSLVFLDIHLPELEGTKVFDEIRKIDGEAKIYFTSGSSDEIDKMKAANKPAKGYLLKPIDFQDVFKILEENK